MGTAQPVPLDQTPAGIGFGVSSGLPLCTDSDNPPSMKNEAVILATFKSYQVYFTPSHRNVYTKIVLGIERVLEAGPSGVVPGQEIDFLIQGGTVRLDNGKVLSYGFSHNPGEKRFTVRPGHTYLFFLEYHLDGNFYIGIGSWELRNGYFVPNDLCNAVAVRKGVSRFAGMSKDSFLQAMQRALQTR